MAIFELLLSDFACIFLSMNLKVTKFDPDSLQKEVLSLKGTALRSFAKLEHVLQCAETLNAIVNDDKSSDRDKVSAIKCSLDFLNWLAPNKGVNGDDTNAQTALTLAQYLQQREQKASEIVAARYTVTGQSDNT